VRGGAGAEVCRLLPVPAGVARRRRDWGLRRNNRNRLGSVVAFRFMTVPGPEDQPGHPRFCSQRRQSWVAGPSLAM